MYCHVPCHFLLNCHFIINIVISNHDSSIVYFQGMFIKKGIDLKKAFEKGGARESQQN